MTEPIKSMKKILITLTLFTAVAATSIAADIIIDHAPLTPIEWVPFAVAEVFFAVLALELTWEIWDD